MCLPGKRQTKRALTGLAICGTVAGLLVIDHFVLASYALSMRVRNATDQPVSFRYRAALFERGRVTIPPQGTVYPIVYRGEGRPTHVVVQCEVEVSGKHFAQSFNTEQFKPRDSTLVISEKGFEVLVPEAPAGSE